MEYTDCTSVLLRSLSVRLAPVPKATIMPPAPRSFALTVGGAVMGCRFPEYSAKQRFANRSFPGTRCGIGASPCCDRPDTGIGAGQVELPEITLQITSVNDIHFTIAVDIHWLGRRKAVGNDIGVESSINWRADFLVPCSNNFHQF